MYGYILCQADFFSLVCFGTAQCPSSASFSSSDCAPVVILNVMYRVPPPQKHNMMPHVSFDGCDFNALFSNILFCVCVCYSCLYCANLMNFLAHIQEGRQRALLRSRNNMIDSSVECSLLTHPTNVFV